MQTRWQHSRPELPSCYQMWSICCQETAQSWKGADQPFDAVLLFHCLYYIPQLERPALFKKLFDNVVANGGLVFIVTSPCNLENTTSLWRLFERLSLPSYSVFEVIDGVQVRDMMTSVGFHECYQLPIEYQLDAEEPNDDLMSVFVFWSRGMLSLENVREAANEVFGNEKCLPNDVWFGVFEKSESDVHSNELFCYFVFRSKKYNKPIPIIQISLCIWNTLWHIFYFSTFSKFCVSCI